MNNSTSSALSDIIFVATAVSSTVVSLPYEVDYSFEGRDELKDRETIKEANITDWSDNVFDITEYYVLESKTNEKIETIVSFSQKIISNTKDLDGDYVDVVNDNFWDLI